MQNNTATFSPCRKYRYDLWRVWNTNKPFCLFIGLNPSSATETIDDPTIRRCIQYSKDWNYGALCMTNLFAFRATLPKDMKAQQDPIGPDNDKILKERAASAGIVIAAWGKDGKYLNRDEEVIKNLPIIYCLKQNKDKTPAHPLYLKKDLMPYRYDS